MKSSERRVTQVPVFVIAGFLVFFTVQVIHHGLLKTSSSAAFQQLSKPEETKFYRAISMGSDQLVSFLMLLAVQLHDNQKGRHFNYRHLDYTRLSQWLWMLYELNPRSDYSAFLATRVYSQVPDTNKIRQMVALVDKMFDKNPRQNWRSMTEACVLAKHQLKDLPLALRLAEKIHDLPASVEIPYWARDMKLVLLDELNQLESAQLLISSMLQGGEIKDPDEIRFLRSRLLKIQQQMLKNKQ